MASRKRRLAAHRASRDGLLSALDAQASRVSDDGLVDLFGADERGAHDVGDVGLTDVDVTTQSTVMPGERTQVWRRVVPSRPVGRPGRGRAAMWSSGWALMCLGAVVAFSMGAAVLGHRWQWRWLVAGGAVAIAGGSLLVGNRPGRGSASRWAAPGIAAVVVVLLMIGARGSILIDNRPVLANSTQAQAHREVQRMAEDLELLVDIDELLGLPTSEARARSQEIIDMRPRAESLSARWANTGLDDLPTGEFAPVAVKLAAASFAGSEALVRKEALLGSNDARITAELESFRATLTGAVLEAGPQLRALGELYDAEVQLGTPRERE